MTRRSFLPEALWAVFAAANVALMFLIADWQTVPFHLVWLSLTLLYGFRLWAPMPTALVVWGIALTTGTALWVAALEQSMSLDELTEVPLMSALFVAMVWHARRRQEALDEVAQARSREREFVRDASHELRTPITVARGNAELLLAERPELEEEVGLIVGELDRLRSIADRLLTLAVADKGLPPAIVPLSAGELVRHAIRRWQPTAERVWRSEIEEDGTLHADRARIECALDALMENAVEATDETDAITVACRGRGASLEIEVRDTGRGIPHSALARVFDRFARGAHGSGTGLGLAMVRAVAESHGGTATASSEPGAPTCVRITVPGFQPAQAGDAQAADAHTDTAPGGDAQADVAHAVNAA